MGAGQTRKNKLKIWWWTLLLMAFKASFFFFYPNRVNLICRCPQLVDSLFSWEPLNPFVRNMSLLGLYFRSFTCFWAFFPTCFPFRTQWIIPLHRLKKRSKLETVDMFVLQCMYFTSVGCGIWRCLFVGKNSWHFCACSAIRVKQSKHFKALEWGRQRWMCCP